MGIDYGNQIRKLLQIYYWQLLRILLNLILPHTLLLPQDSVKPTFPLSAGLRRESNHLNAVMRLRLHVCVGDIDGYVAGYWVAQRRTCWPTGQTRPIRSFYPALRTITYIRP
jgi:hypothetical protein